MKKKDEWFMEWSTDDHMEQFEDLERYVDDIYGYDTGDELDNGEFFDDDFTY